MQTANKLTRQALLHILVSLGAVVTLVPLIWLVAAALKGPEDFFYYTFFPPLRKITLHNFHKLLNELPFFRLMINSLFVTGATVLIQLFLTSLGGFALAKYQFKGKRLFMLLMLATMMIPAQVLLAPLYELICRMRLADTYAGLILPSSISVFGMLGIFLFRQSMLQIPDDLLQAGRIDGCSEFGLYWNIAIPVSRPMIGAFCLVGYLGIWNSFLWPQIILNNAQRFTLAIGLNQLIGLQERNYGVLMAGTLLSILPVVVLFFVLQKEFIRGITEGAVKG